MIQLQTMTDRDFAWLLGEVSEPADAPRVCTGGVAPTEVIALIPIARAAGHAGLTAETAGDNRASQPAPERNGFVRTGERTDPEDGALYLWALDWTQDKA